LDFFRLKQENLQCPLKKFAMDLIAGYGGDDEPAPEPTPGVAVEGAVHKAKVAEVEDLPAGEIPPEMLTGFDEMRSKMMVNLAPVVKEKEQVRATGIFFSFFFSSSLRPVFPRDEFSYSDHSLLSKGIAFCRGPEVPPRIS
jgi:hypothetical protein